MKKFGSLLVKLLTAVIIASSISPACVYGEEIIPVEDGDLNIPELTEDAYSETVVEADTYPDALTAVEQEDNLLSAEEPAAGAGDLTGDMQPGDELTGSLTVPDTNDASGYADLITKIEAPQKTEYSFRYKSALVAILKKLPKTIRVYRGSRAETINVTWKCEKDYNEDLEEYPFVPDMTGYSLANDIVLPKITVMFTEEWPEFPEGALNEDLDFRMPVPEDTYQMSMGTFPVKYSNEDDLPAVRNQNPYGTCWTFANIAAVESDLIMDGASKSTDLSELQLAYYGWNTYKDPKKCKTVSIKHNGNPETYLKVGGTQRQAAHLLSSHIGAVPEKTVQYSSASTFKGGKGGNEYLTAKDTAHIKSAYYIDYEDRKGIKRAIILHGAVATSYGHNEKYYDFDKNSYYSPKGRQDGEGHAIAFVGWDDDFPKENFKNVSGLPKGDGAWLVRNSWGPDWGKDGYFWMSYYDAGLSNKKGVGVGFVIAYDAVKESVDNCYAYDGEILQDTYTEKFGKAFSVRQTFPVSGGEAVNSIGFEVLSADVNARVTVKNKKTGETSVGSINTSYAGFYTVKLKRSLYISGKSNVEVTIDFSSKNTIRFPIEYTGDVGSIKTPGGIIRIAGVYDKGFEYKLNNSSKYVKVKSNDSRIKLYTVKSKAPKKVPVQSVGLNKKKSTIKKGKTLQLKAKIIPTNATNKKVTWSTSNKKVATVTQKGLVKGVKAGKATITVTTKDGKKKAKCKITVKKK